MEQEEPERGGHLVHDPSYPSASIPSRSQWPSIASCRVVLGLMLYSCSTASHSRLVMLVATTGIASATSRSRCGTSTSSSPSRATTSATLAESLVVVL